MEMSVHCRILERSLVELSTTVDDVVGLGMNVLVPSGADSHLPVL
jgi:hypothetical protein